MKTPPTRRRRGRKATPKDISQGGDYIPLVILGITEDGIARPHCEKHGAMLCVNKELSLYRCTVCTIGIDMSQFNQYVIDEMASLLANSSNKKGLKKVNCPYAENWKNQGGWFEFNGKLVCLDWDDYCTLCRVDDTKDFEFTVDPNYIPKSKENGDQK